ncbi:MAG: hypothetical protein Q4F57_04455 [Weeksellaceae bacterium]|nr:hypothetical protein [Weeksellaceae bacterium]
MHTTGVFGTGLRLQAYASACYKKVTQKQFSLIAQPVLGVFCRAGSQHLLSTYALPRILLRRMAARSLIFILQSTFQPNNMQANITQANTSQTNTLQSSAI